MKKKIPLALIILRLILAPVIIMIAVCFKDEGRIAILILMYLGLFSDIFDGIIARQLNIATTRLRRLDSQVDMIFWVSIGISAWIVDPVLIKNNQITIGIIFITEGMCYLVSLIKFRKENCTHAFMSKLWGVTLLIGFTSLIGFSYAGIPFGLAIVCGLISHVDIILITLILPEWTHDVPSCYHAYLIRKGVKIKRNKLLN